MELMAEYPVKVTHPEKVLWPDARITKIDYMHYLVQIGPTLLKYLANRPLTMIRFPDGVTGHSFYQKDTPAGTPEWVKTAPIWSTDKNDYIHYVIADSLASLLWLGNIGCLEMHVGFTTLTDPDHPTHIAFDLDPTAPGFEPVRRVALTLHHILEQLNLPHVAKTSGATGLQIFIPLAPGYSFDQTRLFTKTIAEYVQAQLPEVVTLERLTKNRGNKVYIDYPQHGSSRTLIAPYSARATQTATVSTPVRWSELTQGAVPTDFTVSTVPKRVAQLGDLMECGPGAHLEPILSFLERGLHTSPHL